MSMVHIQANMDPSLAIRLRAKNVNVPPPKVPPDRTRSTEDVMPGIIKKLGLVKEKWRSDLTGAWEEVVGKHLAQHTRPGDVHGKTLIVYVTHSTWLAELSRFGKQEILSKLQNRFGKDKIRQLRLQLDPGSEDDS